MALDAEHREWLTLTLVPGVGTSKFIRLLARFRTPGNVLAASECDLREIVNPALAKRIKQYSQVVDVAKQERELTKYGAHILTLDDSAYPVRLAEIYDPPLVLFLRGQLLEQDAHCIAVVGTRRPTPYGERMAEKLGAELAARGITVVSGMAAGIDSAAHRGALSAGGRTIAVLGCGVDVVFPKQNAELMEHITENGCVLSEFEMGVQPRRGNFPLRNRIISGMTIGTVIVQAPARSGALITARQAAEQGREVFAVPGQAGDPNSAGPHALIREGAKLVESVEDVLVELDLPPNHRFAAIEMATASHPIPSEPKPAAAPPAQRPRPPKPTAPAPNVSQDEKSVLAVLEPDGSHVDEIAQACRIPISKALSSLTLLELKGLVRQFSGKRFARR